MFHITFYDYDGRVLKNEYVAAGASAHSPTQPSRKGYIFVGWSDAYTNVQSDKNIFALYQPESLDEILTIIRAYPRGEDVRDAIIKGLNTIFQQDIKTNLSNHVSFGDQRPISSGAVYKLFLEMPIGDNRKY